MRATTMSVVAAPRVPLALLLVLLCSGAALAALGLGSDAETRHRRTGRVPEDAPTEVNVTANGPNTLDVQWRAVPPLPGRSLDSLITGYLLHHRPVSGPGCEDMQCPPPPSACKQPGYCKYGTCEFENKPDNTICDDGDSRTRNDRCHDGECVGDREYTPVDGPPVSYHLDIDTMAHGAGFMPRLNEFWYPQWSGEVVSRYARDGTSLGTFTAGTSAMLQVWGEPDSLYYYAATSSPNRCEKLGPFPFHNSQWSYDPGSHGSMGGISTDEKYAYCIQFNSPTVHVLDKMSGDLVRKFNLTGGQVGPLYGGFAVVRDKIYYGTSNMFFRYNLHDGSYDGFSFRTQESINNMAFTGQDLCISDNTDNVYCYRVLSHNIFYNYTAGPELLDVIPEGRSVVTDTQGLGGGYVPFLDEYWYPAWSQDKVHRYSSTFTRLGSFNAPAGEIRQIWGDHLSSTYFMAAGNSVFRVRWPKNTEVWGFDLGQGVGGVCRHGDTVYAMAQTGPDVTMLRAEDGQKIGTFALSDKGGDKFGTLVGSLVAVAGKLYRGDTEEKRFYRYDLATGAFDYFSYSVSYTLSTTAFNGEEICISPGGSDVQCHQITTHNIYSPPAFDFQPLISGSQILSRTMNQQLSQLLPNRYFRRCFSTQRDESLASVFHDQCNNKGPTVTIARRADTGRVFGAFTTLSWRSSGQYLSDSKAFLFKFEEDQVFRTDNDLEQPAFAVHDAVDNCPTFGRPPSLPTRGSGHDLYIDDKCSAGHSKADSYRVDGSTYNNQWLTGGATWEADVVEVFAMSLDYSDASNDIVSCDNIECPTSVCVPANMCMRGVCTGSVLADGTPCETEDDNTAFGTCMGGVCVGGQHYTEDATSYSLSGLSAGQTYEVEVQAFTSGGGGPLSAPVNASTREVPPTIGPMSFTARAVNATTALVTWQPPPFYAHNGHLLGYKVRAHRLNDPPQEVGATTETSFYVKRLEPSTTYSVSVYAYNAAGSSQISTASVHTLECTSVACPRCDPCPFGQYRIDCSLTNAGQCVGCASCSPGQYREGCANSSPGACVECASCPYGKVRVSCADLDSGSCEYCPQGQYFHSAASRCIPTRDCDPGEYITQAATVTSNRGCSSCASGKLSVSENQQTCSEPAPCPFGEIEETPPTASSDRECQPCTLGATFFDKSTGACESVSSCPDGAFVAQQPTLVNDTVCESEAYTCSDGTKEAPKSGSCSCAAFGNACSSCHRQGDAEQNSDAVLLMLNAQPQDYVPIRTISFSHTTPNIASVCASKCSFASDEGCVGFTLVQMGSNGMSCTLVSSYREEESPAKTALFYVLPQCRACAQGHVLDDLGCTQITEAPVFTQAETSALIPINVEVGTVIANVTASSNAPGEQANITYSLEMESDSFAINNSTGEVYVAKSLLTPVAIRLSVVATDSRPQCHRSQGSGVVKEEGPCVSAPASVDISVVALLGCPSDINEYVDLSLDNKTVSWDTAPRFPSTAPALTLLLLQDDSVIDPSTTEVTVPIGQTVFTYKSQESLTIGDQIKCSFTVSIRNGFVVEADDVDVRETDTSHIAFIVSSRDIASTARLPPFTSDLSKPFFIGVQSSTRSPLIISPPDGVQGDVTVAFRWCTSNTAFPSSPNSDNTQAVVTNVTLAGVGSLSTAPSFTDQGSWLFVGSNRRCLNIAAKSSVFTEPLEFVTLEVEVNPPAAALNRRRRNAPLAQTFIPSSPSLLAVELSSANLNAASLAGAVTFEDLVPPLFLACPPPLSTRTFPVAEGETEATVVLPPMTAFDAVDKSPSVQYPFQSANLSAIGSPHSVTVHAVDGSSNRRPCTFDVFVTVEERELQQRETLESWQFPLSQRVVSETGFVFYTHGMYSDGGGLSSFYADLSQLTKLLFTFESPSPSVPFVVRTDLMPERARIAVNMRWEAVGATPPVLYGHQDHTLAFVRLEGVHYDDDDENTPAETVDVQLPEHYIAVSEADGLVAVSGRSTLLSRPFSFTSATLILRFLAVQDTTGFASFTLTNTSFIGIEYEYEYMSANNTLMPSRSDVRGFLALRDLSPPLFTRCPADITVATAPGTGTAMATWQTPIATDNRQVDYITSTASSGASFSILPPNTSPVQVVFTAHDLFGNTATCSFDVNVVDNEAPVVPAAPVVSKTLPSDASFVAVAESEWRPSIVTDNAQDQGGAWAQPQLAWHNASASYGFGVHVIGMRFVDAFGNAANATATVNVTDTTPPILVCPSTIERLADPGETSTTVSWTMADPSDNTRLPVAVTVNRTSGSVFAVGEHVVGVLATDVASLQTTCTFRIRVVGQATAPGTNSPQPNTRGSPFDSPESSSSSAASTSIIAGAGAAGGLLLLLILAVLVFVARSRARARAPQNWEDIFNLMSEMQGSEEGFRYPRELNRGALKLLDELGKGCFGIVYKAMLKEHSSIPGYLVGVKSLHDHASVADRQELLEEAAVTAQFTSPHVVELVGVVTVGNPVYVVVEFMEHGSLKGFLEEHDVPLETLMLWAGDCCEGLAHIHGKGFIHRDVAARNVLVSSEKRCKISDFGLAREMEDDDTYYKSRGGQLPVRWTAIEALEDRKFNEKTDVWSCGILIHEIWTRAELPYNGWSNQKVWVEVAAGYRMPKPEGCSDAVYEQMHACWHEKQEDRPKFAELASFFRSQHAVLTGEEPPADDGYLQVKCTSPLDAANNSSNVAGGDVDAQPQNVYDMGGDDASASLPNARNSEADAGAGAMDLYDFGDDSNTNAGTNNSPSASGAADALYDMGDNDTGAPVQGTAAVDGANAADLYDFGDDSNNNAGTNNSPSASGAADALYDMGDNDTGAPVQGTAAVDGANAADLYDFGDDNPTQVSGGGGRTQEEAVYDMGDDDTAPANDPMYTLGDEPEVPSGFGPSSPQQNQKPAPSGELYGNTGDDAPVDETAGPTGRKRGDVSAADVGKRVRVQGYAVLGTLRFHGPHHQTGASRCGVELDEPLGKNNGTVKGHKYFKCKQNHGLLCSYHKVTVLEE